MKDKLFWFWEDVKEFFDDYGAGIFAMLFVLGIAMAFFLVPNGDKKKRVVEPYVPTYSMIYFIGCDGVAYDSVKVERPYFSIWSEGVDYWENDLKREYNGVYLVKELE